MRVYSTRRFLILLSASIIIALALVYSVITIVPSISPSHSPSYILSTTPSSLQVTPGAAGSYTLKLTSQFGFSGLLKLAARVPNAPNSLAVSLSPSEVQLAAGGSASTTLQAATNPVTPAGTYSIAIDETSGLLTHTDTVNLDVVGFSVSANPASLIFQPDATGASTISITSINSFSGQVNLFASSSASGPTVSVSPNTLFVPQNRTATSTLTVQSSAQGRFDVTVTVIGDQFYQSVSLPVAATSSTSTNGDFNMTMIPSSFSINPGNFRNVVVKLGSLGSCGCLVTISASPSATAFAYGISPYIVEVPAGGSANSTLTLAANPNAVPGVYTITVTGTSLSIVHSAQLTANITTIPVADVSLEANPLFVHVAQGSSSSTTITITSLAGFAGTVSLTASTTPSDGNIALSLNPSSVQLPSGGTAIATLTINATKTASVLGYNFTVTGTSGTLSRDVYGNIIVSASPLAAAALETPTATRSPLPSSFTGQPIAELSNILVTEPALNAFALTIAIALVLAAIPPSPPPHILHIFRFRRGR